jgi:hypothetical protein
MEPPLPAGFPIGQRAPTLINLREFRATAKELQQEDTVAPGFEASVDISTDEVKRVTPFERIEDAIQNALVRVCAGKRIFAH